DYGNVQKRTNHQRGDDSDREIALRILRLFGGGRDGMASDVCKKNDRAARQDSRPAIRRIRMPIRRMNEPGAEPNEDNDRHDFEQDHYVVRFSGLADASHEDD